MLRSSINDSEGQTTKKTQKCVYVFRRRRDLLQSLFIWIILTNSTSIYGVNVPHKRQLFSVMILFFKPCWLDSYSLLISSFASKDSFSASLCNSQGEELGKIHSLFQLLRASGLSCDLPTWIPHNLSLTLHSSIYQVFFTT